jgi:hypothetical protein
MDRIVSVESARPRVSPIPTRDALYAALFAFFAVSAMSDLAFLVILMIGETRNFFWATVSKPLLVAGLLTATPILILEFADWLRRAPVGLTGVAVGIMAIEACNFVIRAVEGPGMIVPLGASLSLLVILLIPTAIRRKAEKTDGL